MRLLPKFITRSSTIPTWTVLVTALAAPLVSIAVAYITLRATNQREAKRLDVEKQLKMADLEHDKQTEERKNRLQAYRNMAKAGKTLGFTRKIDPDAQGGRNDLTEAFAEITLLTNSSEVREAAEQLLNATIRARRTTA